MDWGNVSLLEVIWTAMAGLALLLWIGGIVTALRDARALRGRANYRAHGPRALIVRGRLWTSVLDALVQLGMVLLGLSAMLTPPPLRTINQEQATRGGILLIGIEAILLIRVVVTAVSRVRTDRVLDRMSHPRKRSTHDTADQSP